MVRIATNKEYLEKRGQLAARAKALSDAVKDRAFTDEERSQFGALQTEAKELETAVEEFRSRAQLDMLAMQGLAEPRFAAGDNSADNPFTRLGEFRLFRAIRGMIPGEGVLSGIEKEVHDELAKRSEALGIQTRGIRIPHALPMGVPERRVTDTTAGAGALNTVVSRTFIDVLRANLVLQQAGAQVVGGLVGSFKMPRKSTRAAGAWVGESTAATAADMTIGSVTFAGKEVCCATVLSRTLMHQTALDLEMIARNDLVLGIAEAIDLAGFHGTGSSNQPQGIAANSSCPTVTIGTNGGALTWAKLIELITTVLGANAEALRMVTSPVGYGHMLTTVKVSGHPTYLAENGQAAGLPILRSTQISKTLTKGSASGTCTAAFCGDFSQAMIGLWGSLDLIVDPFSGKPDVSYSVYQTADVQFRNPQGITKCLDIVHGL
jgi:HK97 family phage major capsid protein